MAGFTPRKPQRRDKAPITHRKSFWTVWRWDKLLATPGIKSRFLGHLVHILISVKISPSI